MNKKNIAISLLQISYHSPTGAFVYIQNLLDNLLKFDNNNQYWIFLRLTDYGYFKKRYKNYKNINFKIIDIRSDFIFNPWRAILKMFAKIKKNDTDKEDLVRKQLQKFVDRKKINILFFPSTIIYPKNIQNVKTIITVCDIQHEYFPQNFSEKYLKHRKENYQYAVSHADHVIAISDYTRKTIIEKYNINSDKITTIYLGVNEPQTTKNNIILPNNFIFYPAALWPHKNHKLLISLLKRIENQFPDLCLVFTGIIKNHKIKTELDELIKNYNLSKKTFFLGYVSDNDLGYIYQNAKVLIFPSSFEGFGLPIIEAFKFKLPVIAADNSSVNEITKDAGLLFETNNLETLIELTKKILTDNNLREKLINKGLQIVNNFNWNNTAKQTLLLFNKF